MPCTFFHPFQLPQSLRAALHCGGEAHGHEFWRILKFDWPRVTLLSDGGLHYGQESFGGELCTWMKKMTWLPMWQYFFEGFSGGQVSWATSKPRTRNLTSEELPT